MNERIPFAFQINESTTIQRQRVLNILSRYNQKVDSLTEIFDNRITLFDHLPYFSQFSSSNTWGCVSNEVLFSSNKIVPIGTFITKLIQTLKDNQMKSVTIEKIKQMSISEAAAFAVTLSMSDMQREDKRPLEQALDARIKKLESVHPSEIIYDTMSPSEFDNAF